MLKGRQPNVVEQEWLDDSHQVPCLACSLFHDVPDTPAEYHHIHGKTKTDSHLIGYSLCTNHHRVKDNSKPPRYASRHGDGKKHFEQRYMPELGFLEEQRRAVKKLRRLKVGN